VRGKADCGLQNGHHAFRSVFCILRQRFSLANASKDRSKMSWPAFPAVPLREFRTPYSALCNFLFSIAHFALRIPHFLHPQSAFRIPLFMVLFLALAVSELHGVILASGNGAINTIDPGTGLPFCYVGIVNNTASGIFLGSYHGESWVLTANHVGLGPFVLRGTSYLPVSGSGHRLLNPDQSPSDIFLFQISEAPHLLPLKLAHSTPVGGTQVFLVGFGRDRETERSYWIDNGGSWVPTIFGDPQANRIGFKWADPQPGLERWGTALVERSALGINYTVAFYTRFLTRGSSAAVSGGDSGGGAFIREGGQWLLAGMLDSAAALPNQPSGTSIFVNDLGEGSASIIADLSRYESQIKGVIE
jgi:hypothetical protein